MFEWREWWIGIAGTFSHNHPMFASSEVWLLQSVAGIQPHPAAKGFDKVLIKPNPPAKLSHASGVYETVRGRTSSSMRQSTKYPAQFLQQHIVSK